jgi:hypothetical protein
MALFPHMEAKTRLWKPGSPTIVGDHNNALTWGHEESLSQLHHEETIVGGLALKSSSADEEADLLIRIQRGRVDRRLWDRVGSLRGCLAGSGEYCDYIVSTTPGLGYGLWILHTGGDLRLANVGHRMVKIITHRVLHSPCTTNQDNNMQTNLTQELDLHDAHMNTNCTKWKVWLLILIGGSEGESYKEEEVGLPSSPMCVSLASSRSQQWSTTEGGAFQTERWGWRVEIGEGFWWEVTKSFSSPFSFSLQRARAPSIPMVGWSRAGNFFWFASPKRKMRVAPQKCPVQPFLADMSGGA